MNPRARSGSDPPAHPPGETERRIASLTRLSTVLAQARSERELAMRLSEEMRELVGARQVGLYVRSPSTRQLVPAPGTPGDALLRMVCAVAPDVPERLRVAPGGPELLDHLREPLVAPADGVRGPLLAAPLADPHGEHGLLAVEGEPSLPPYDELDRDVLVGVAAQACLALSRLRSERTSAEHAASTFLQMEQARTVQRKLLPSLPASIEGFRVAVTYAPAFHVGGDFYDVVPVAPGVITTLIGDVAGKGVSAALLMSRLQADFRRLCVRGEHPHRLLATLNQQLGALLPDDCFATAACLRLDLPARTLTVANAGHILPVVRRRTGAVISVGRAAGAALGMLPDESFGEQHLPLAPGDIVLLMTDGVVEAVDNDPRNMWRLIDIVASSPPDVEIISRRILEAVEQSLGNRRIDDVTLLALMPEPTE